jgi:tetrapyrrole methylase family protein/MazG family protein
MPHDFSPTFDGLLALCAHLRSPEGCPWDHEQTHESLKPMLVEETYEFLDAIDGGDTNEMVEELGDVLYHMMFQIQIGREAGTFDEQDVVRTVQDKLIRRHPHIFGDTTVSDAREVESRWQEIKRKEKSAEGKGTLDSVPNSMPALAYAQAIGERAARVGFEWKDFDGVLDKVREEIDEFREAGTPAEKEAELGDVLFTLVNVARWHRINAEGSLRATDAKFRKRFTHMEKLAAERGLSFPDLTIDQKEELWVEAKRVVG